MLDVLVEVYEGNVSVRVYEGIVTEVSEETPASSLCRGGTCAASRRCPLDREEKGERRQKKGSEVSVFHSLSTKLWLLIA